MLICDSCALNTGDLPGITVEMRGLEFKFASNSLCARNPELWSLPREEWSLVVATYMSYGTYSRYRVTNAHTAIALSRPRPEGDFETPPSGHDVEQFKISDGRFGKTS